MPSMPAPVIEKLCAVWDSLVADKKFAVVRELLYWSYANLAMAHSAVSKGQEKYAMVRARLFKGLVCGSMNVGTLFDDEKVKLRSGQMCSYCASTDKLALDHIFPQKHGGKDSGDKCPPFGTPSRLSL